MISRLNSNRRGSRLAALAALFLLAFTAAFAQRGDSSGGGGTSGTTPDAIIAALSTGDVYVGPEFGGEVDANALSAAAQAARPTIVKIVAIRSDSAPWLKQYASRDAFAADLRSHLSLPDNAIVLVGTQKGISASTGDLKRDEINEALKNAGLSAALARGGLTAALVTATQAVSTTAVSDQHAKANRSGAFLFVVLAAIASVILWRASRVKKEMDSARSEIEPLRQQALESLTFVDGYLDLLPEGNDASQAKNLRQAAYDQYATAAGLLKIAKTPDQVRQAGPLLADATRHLTACREAIDRATGGTGVAMRIPETPSLKTDEQRARDYMALMPVEGLGSSDERARMQQLIENIPPGERGVSFFSGRPVPSDELVPVEIVVGGKKRTVMASRDEAQAIAQGRTPPVRAFQQEGRYIPWYEYRGYDPYRDYYGGSGLGTLVDLYVLTELFGPSLWTGYGPWGYGGFGWGMPLPIMGIDTGFDGGVGGYSDSDFGIGNNVAPDYAMSQPDDNTGGFDFLGGGGAADSVQTDNSGGFDFFGGGGNDTGDSGGADFGGGDFGGGDSGGGGGDW